MERSAATLLRPAAIPWEARTVEANCETPCEEG